MNREKILGPDHADVAASLLALATIYNAQGRYADAEPLHKRSLSIWEKTLGPHHPHVALGLSNLALLYDTQGRYAEAEPLIKRSLAIREKVLGPDHPDVAFSVNNLATLYVHQGRHADAEPLYKRALAIWEKALGPEHRDVATSLNNLAGLYDAQGRTAEAEPLYKRALATREKVLGPDHPDVAFSLNNLAALYWKQGRHADAEPLYKRALAVWEKALGPEHPDVALSLNNLAELYRVQGQFADAEPLYKRSLAIREKALGPDHPDVAQSLVNLAVSYSGQGHNDDALIYIRRATAIYRARAASAGGDHSKGVGTEIRQQKDVFLLHVLLLSVLAANKTSFDPAALRAEAFEIMQIARASDTGKAVAGMAARFAAGSDVLAQVVRERQDAEVRWQALDARLVATVGKPPAERNAEAEARLRQDLVEVDTKLKDLDVRIAKDFPAYAELATPKPLAITEAQALLGPEEAAVVFAILDDITFVYVLRQNRSVVSTVKENIATIRSRVEAIRFAMDEDIPPFPAGEAHALYQTLLAPVAETLAGAKTVFVVPDGPLQGLPFALLLDAPPPAEMVEGPALKPLPWLARTYGFVTLPAVSSLRALRRFAGTSVAPEPFIGIGDPLLGDHPILTRGSKAGGQRRLARRALPSNDAARGFFGDVQALKGAPSLPDTADELAALARLLGAPADKALVLRERATEPVVRTELSLANYQVISFATHGLTSTDLPRFAEPALLLTPPEQASPENDGLLAASEIAKLKMNADWVILSACNTAAPDGTPGAEGLSGLAKAFFYAGTRALLVSHWPVVSETTVKLTGHMFKEAKAHPEIGRAEAHRRAMLALIDDPNPQFAHPLFWAPFVVVGEGGTYRPE